MLIVGHRGVPSLEPENTISSFKKAIEVGADMIEMDLRLSKDGEIVIIHDATLHRLFGRWSKVSELTLSEIKQVSKASGREIPTFKEVLNEVSAPLNLHIKISGIEQQVLDMIKSFPHKILISSVFPKILKKVRSLDGNIDLGLIIGKSELHLMFILNKLVKGLGLYSIHPKNILVSFGSMPILKRQGRKVIIWDVNTQADLIRAQKLGAYGVITDFTQLFRKNG